MAITITYQSTHGTAPSPSTVQEPYTLLAADLSGLTADGFRFRGWAKTNGGSEYYEAGDVITESVAMFADWAEKYAVMPLNDYKAACDAIREKTGESGEIMSGDLADEIESISGGGITVEALSVTANGTYTADDGSAYSPVMVDVQPSMQSKTISPKTSQQTVTPDSGYDGLSSVTVSAITPTKSAQTYTPRTANQTIASGRWLTGTQTIKGDANLIPDNIKSGVTIFNVTGSYNGGGLNYFEYAHFIGGTMFFAISKNITTGEVVCDVLTDEFESHNYGAWITDPDYSATRYEVSTGFEYLGMYTDGGE